MDARQARRVRVEEVDVSRIRLRGQTSRQLKRSYVKFDYVISAAS